MAQEFTPNEGVGIAADDAVAIQHAAVEQHLAETRIVHGGRDQPTATGFHRGLLQHVEQLDLLAGPGIGWEGFGKTTGIDIAGESQGLLPTKACRQSYYHTAVDRQWRPGDSVLLAIGQGALLVTPLQLAVGYAAIANGGYVVTPHIGDDIEDDSDGTHLIRDLTSNFPRRKVALEPGLLTAIHTGLEEATHDPLGTAAPVLAHFKVDVAGKTGTAQRTGEPDTAIFAS